MLCTNKGDQFVYNPSVLHNETYIPFNTYRNAISTFGGYVKSVEIEDFEDEEILNMEVFFPLTTSN